MIETFSTMLTSITKLFNNVKTPFQTLPPIILALGSIMRPGASAIEVASTIIERQKEAGAPYGPCEDGTQNVAEAMERIRVEEILKAIKLNTKVQISIPIGAIQIIGTGANSGGPVVIEGFNINFVEGTGIIA